MTPKGSQSPDGSITRFFVILGGPGEVSEWLKEHAWKACVPKRYRGFESLPLRQLPRLLPHPPQSLVGVDPVVVAVGPLDLERVGADRTVGHELEGPLGQGTLRTSVHVAEEISLAPAHRAGTVAPQHLERQVVLASIFPDDHELLADVDDVRGNVNGHESRLPQSVDDEEVGQCPRVTVNVGASIPDEENRSDRVDAGRVRGDQLTPDLSPAARNFEAVDLRGNLADAIEEEEPAVRGPSDPAILEGRAGKRNRLSALKRIEVRLAVGSHDRN